MRICYIISKIDEPKIIIQGVIIIQRSITLTPLDLDYHIIITVERSEKGHKNYQETIEAILVGHRIF